MVQCLCSDIRVDGSCGCSAQGFEWRRRRRRWPEERPSRRSRCCRRRRCSLRGSARGRAHRCIQRAHGPGGSAREGEWRPGALSRARRFVTWRLCSDARTAFRPRHCSGGEHSGVIIPARRPRQDASACRPHPPPVRGPPTSNPSSSERGAVFRKGGPRRQQQQKSRVCGGRGCRPAL